MLDLVVPARLDDPAVVGAAVPRSQEDPAGPRDQPPSGDAQVGGLADPDLGALVLAGVHQADRRVDVGEKPGQGVGDEQRLHATARSGSASSPRAAARHSSASRGASGSSWARVRPRTRVVVHEGGEGPDHLRDPLLWLDVEEADLEIPTARPHRREQRGQVLVGIGERRGAPREVGVRRHRVPTAQQPVVERRAVGVDREPGREPGVRADRTRESCGEVRPGQVEHPPLLEAGPSGPPVEADLGRGRAAHHPAAGRAEGVEVRLHGGVAGGRQLQRHRVRRAAVDGGGVEHDPGPRQVDAQRRHGVPQSADDGRRRTARLVQLDLSTGLEREFGAGGRADPLDGDRSPGRGVAGEQLVLDAHPGRAPVAGAGEEP